MVDNYEVFVIDRNRNLSLSLEKDDIYFFNKTNFDAEAQKALDNNNLDYLINNGLALRFDSQMVYRMYLGFVNKNLCYSCKQRLGYTENNKGFGNLPA